MQKADNRHWDIVNTRSNLGYRLTPSKTDRKSSDREDNSGYGVGDLWLVKADAKIDDSCMKVPGSWPAEPGDCTQADFNTIMNGKVGEDVQQQDQVLWYSASFMHHQSHDDPNVPHIVGPTLEPIGTW